MFNESQVRAYCLAALATLFLPHASATDWATSRSVEIKSNGTSSTQWKNVQTQVVSAGGVDYAYRELGQENARPLDGLHCHASSLKAGTGASS